VVNISAKRPKADLPIPAACGEDGLTAPVAPSLLNVPYCPSAKFRLSTSLGPIARRW